MQEHSSVKAHVQLGLDLQGLEEPARNTKSAVSTTWHRQKHSITPTCTRVQKFERVPACKLTSQLLALTSTLLSQHAGVQLEWLPCLTSVLARTKLISL